MRRPLPQPSCVSAHIDGRGDQRCVGRRRPSNPRFSDKLDRRAPNLHPVLPHGRHNALPVGHNCCKPLFYEGFVMAQVGVILIAGRPAARFPAAAQRKIEMKSLFLATAALAAFAAAPALAQDGIGSVGVTYGTSDVDVLGLSGDSEAVKVDAGFAVPITADWTVTLDGAFAYNLDGAADQDDSNVSGRIHASREFGNVRVAGFAGGSQAGEEQLWSFGAQAQTYLDKLTLTGSLAYETIDGVDADMWSLGGD